MLVSDLIWLWRSTQNTFSELPFLRRSKVKLRLFASGLKHIELVRQFREAENTSSLGRLISYRPHMIGVLLWPYQCAAWGPQERLKRIINHCQLIDEYASPLDFSPDTSLVLLDLEEIKSGFRIVLDQPKWFMREGQLVINIFLGDFRAFSLAFSLHRGRDGVVQGIIGGIQGRKKDGILDTYRDLTKKLHGQRPRDFLIEVFRMFCRYHDIGEILAVSDGYRHHRHPYFGLSSFSTDYDDIWRDRGGQEKGDMFFQLNVAPERRELTEIKSKKRAMYRKRYALLDDIEKRINENMKDLEPVRFTDS